jgi:hypothetical protein
VGWAVESTRPTGGGSRAYFFTSHLTTATGGANNATLRYLFNTFGSDQLITTGTCISSPGNRPYLLEKALPKRELFTRFVYIRTIESNYSFPVTPALLKFSLNVTSWNWNSGYAPVSFARPSWCTLGG